MQVLKEMLKENGLSDKVKVISLHQELKKMLRNTG